MKFCARYFISVIATFSLCETYLFASFIYLFIYFIYLLVCLFLCLCICLLYLFTRLFIYLFISRLLAIHHPNISEPDQKSCCHGNSITVWRTQGSAATYSQIVFRRFAGLRLQHFAWMDVRALTNAANAQSCRSSFFHTTLANSLLAYVALSGVGYRTKTEPFQSHGSSQRFRQGNRRDPPPSSPEYTGAAGAQYDVTTHPYHVFTTLPDVADPGFGCAVYCRTCHFLDWVSSTSAWTD